MSKAGDLVVEDLLPPPPPPPRVRHNGAFGVMGLARAARLGAFLAAPLLAFLAAPVAAQTASITSTPPNGTHYVAGDAITSRIAFSPGLESGSVHTAEMKLDIGGTERRASSTSTWVRGLRSVNFSYTVTADDFDTDGVSIPANAIDTMGSTWRALVQGVQVNINLNNAAVGAQASQQVIGSAASISSTSPAILHENNLDTATVTVALTDVTFGSGVTASSFELVTTMTGVTVNSVSSVSSGDTSATLTLASTADILAAANLAVRVLAAAHTGGTDLTTGTVPVAWVAEWTFGPGAGATVLDMAVEEGYAGFYRMEPSADPGASCTGGVTIGIASDNPAVTVSPTQFSFNSTNWGTTSVDVTATAVEDDNVVDETVTISHTVTTGCTGTYPTTLAIFSVRMTVDDDDTGIFSIDSPRVVEGDSGPTPMIFTVTLAPAASVQATVEYNYLLSGSATSGVDHAAIPSGTLTFAPGETSKTISVTVNGDTDMEPDEGIGLQLSNPAPSGFALASGSGRLASGIIVDDDRPTLTIDSPRVAEGDSGTTQLAFTVTLSPASTGQVTVEWLDATNLSGGTAESGSDYTPLSATGGVLTFAAGETSKTIPVEVRGDSAIEPDETVLVRIDTPNPSGTPIRNAAGAIATFAVGTGTIATDEAPEPSEPTPPPPPNYPPVAVGTFADVALDPGERLEVSLSGKFRDPEGGALAHSAESLNPEVASAVVSEGRLWVEGRSPGLATVVVKATDSGGQSAQLAFQVTVGRVLTFAEASAAAPEGGMARLKVELTRPLQREVAVGYVLESDDDPATADADAADHGGSDGTLALAAGETEAFIEVPILDDDDVEPAREFLQVRLLAPAAEADWALGLAAASVVIQEGVCDRTPEVRDALRGSRECWAPSVAELAGTGYLNLGRQGIGSLRAGDFLGLPGLRVLHLHGNRLAELPGGLFAGLGSLERLRLEGNRLSELPEGLLDGLGRLASLDLGGNRLSSLSAGLLADAPSLSRLDLGGNWLSELPAGFFEGASNLSELDLSGNPGAPFTLTMELTRTDAEAHAPGPATVAAQVAEGAPFALSAGLLAEDAELSADMAAIDAGEVSGAPIQVSLTEGGAARLSLSGAPEAPSALCGEVDEGRYPCFQGLVVEAGPGLLLFKRQPWVVQAVPGQGVESLSGALSLDIAGLFAADRDDALTYSAESSDPALASVKVSGGVLSIEPNGEGLEGFVTVTLTATDSDGLEAVYSFTVEVSPQSRRFGSGWRLGWLMGASAPSAEAQR